MTNVENDEDIIKAIGKIMGSDPSANFDNTLYGSYSKDLYESDLRQLWSNYKNKFTCMGNPSPFYYPDDKVEFFNFIIGLLALTTKGVPLLKKSKTFTNKKEMNNFLKAERPIVHTIVKQVNKKIADMETFQMVDCDPYEVWHLGYFEEIKLSKVKYYSQFLMNRLPFKLPRNIFC